MAQIVIKVVKDEITPFLNKFGGEIPKVMGDALYDITKDGAKLLRRELISQNLIGVSQPTLHRTIEARKISKFRSGIFIPKRGFQLDAMKTHWVSLKRGRNITRWAKKKLKPKRKTLPRAIEVRAHPWIDKPLKRTSRRAVRIMNKRIDEALAK